MTQTGEIEAQNTEVHPALELWAEPRPRLTLKYLHGVIQSLQVEQQNISARVDELANWLEGEPWQNDHNRQLTPPNPQPKEALLLELQEAARIAEEISAHAAAREVAAHAIDESPPSLPDQPIEPAAEPEQTPIFVSRAERHRKPKKRSIWSKLFRNSR